MRITRLHGSSTFCFLAALALAVLFGAVAQGQQATEEEVGDFELDPIGFRGPNPASRFKDIKIQQNLGMQVPLDLVFRDENDQEVRLGDLVTDKPVVLSLVYYGCPMLCTLVLNGMVAGIDGQGPEFALGEAFTAISVSIDPTENGALAQEKKNNYLADMHVENAADNWHFLTGDQASIETLAETVGFRYYYDEPSGQYAHDSGVMILTPKGKVSSYYIGIEYLPGNLRTALSIAGAGTIGKFIKQPSLLCFAYDPTSGTYGLVIMAAIKLGGGLTVAAIVLFWVVNFWVSRQHAGAPIETHAQAAS
jgi:protein SCO1